MGEWGVAGLVEEVSTVELSIKSGDIASADSSVGSDHERFATMIALTDLVGIFTFDSIRALYNQLMCDHFYFCCDLGIHTIFCVRVPGASYGNCWRK